MSRYEPEEYDVPDGYVNARCVICNMRPFNETENSEDFCECITPRWGKSSATSINTIVKDIEDLTDALNTSEELNDAWRKITDALGYLSAKDSMFKYRKGMEKNDSDR